MRSDEAYVRQSVCVFVVRLCAMRNNLGLHSHRRVGALPMALKLGSHVRLKK